VSGLYARKPPQRERGRGGVMQERGATKYGEGYKGGLGSQFAMKEKAERASTQVAMSTMPAG